MNIIDVGGKSIGRVLL